MSFFARVKTAVTDVNTFKKVCDKHNVNHAEGTGQFQERDIKLKLTDGLSKKRNSYNTAYLTANGKGAYELNIDNDVNYCSMSKRLGKNGGILMRDYASEMLRLKLSAVGGMLMSQQEQNDKSLVVRIGLP